MCRDNNETGRRCPCDTSAARQARRVKAHARAVNTETLTTTLTTLQTAANSPTEAPTPVPVTKETVQQQVADVKQLSAEITEYEKLDLNRNRTPEEEARYLELHGKFATIKEPRHGDYYSQHDLAAMHEQQIQSLGENIAELAAQNGTYQTAEEFDAAVAAEMETDPDCVDKVQRKEEATVLFTAQTEHLHQKLTEMTEVPFSEQPDGIPALPVAVWRIKSLFDPENEDNKNLTDMMRIYTAETALQEWKERSQNTEPPLYTDEGMKEIKELLREARLSAHTMSNMTYGLDKARQETLGRLLEERGELYKTTLKDVTGREYGGNLSIAENSAKNLNKVLNQALEVYPKSWIEASNKAAENTSLRIKYTKKRAHYSSHAYQDEISMQPVTENWVKDDGWEPEAGTLESIEWTKLEITDENQGFYYGDNMWVKHENDYAHMQPGFYGRKENTIGYTREGELLKDFPKPRGGGWEPVTFTERTWNPTTREHETIEVNSWKRPLKKRTTSGAKLQAELKIDDSERVGSSKAAGYSTALHELAHRFEHTSGTKLSRLELAFLHRRTVDVNGNREEPLSIYPDDEKKKGDKEEIGWKDNFVSHYTGKTYQSATYFELMSTGVEGVFGNAYGGLIGTNNYAADMEHRNFVLGVLAAE